MSSTRRKKPLNRKKMIFIGFIVALVLVGIFALIQVLRAKVSAEFGDSEEAEILSAEVTVGSISTTVSGSGTLQNETSDEIQIPDTVEVSKIYVRQSDVVEEGEMLAAVNMASLMEAMSGLQEEINSLDEELADLSSDTVDVEITIDELDINLIQVGQTCEVTLDAFTGQSFEAKVNRINQEGENAGGNTKYTVVIRMEKQEDMLLGMNASVKITLESAEDVLVIPASALVEKEDGVYVFTKYTSKSDELSGLVEVTTGLSDGENVEILSGVESGQDFFYRYADKLLFVNTRR